MDISFIATTLINNWHLLLVSLILLGIYTCFFRTDTNPSKLPPGPSGLKATQMITSAFWNEKLHELADTLARKYGEIVLCHTYLGDICFLNSSRIDREVFKGKETESVTNDRPKSFSGWWVLHGFQSVSSSGPSSEHWAAQRKLFHAALKYYGDGVTHFESTVQSELERLKERLGAGNPTLQAIKGYQGQELDEGSKEVEVGSLILYSITCIMVILMTGECPTSDDSIVNLMKDFTYYNDVMFNPANSQIMTMFPFLHLVPGMKYKKLCQDVIRTRDGLLRELFLKNQSNRIPGQPKGIIDFLQSEQSKEGNEWLTNERIFSLIQDLITGAIDTSLNTISSLILLLIHHPEVRVKIQQEIGDNVGERRPCLSDKRLMPYTEATILETLRYLSIVPLGVPHLCTQDISVDGYRIPRKTTLCANKWFYHRDPAVWGDPEHFRPERFLDSDGHLLPSTHPLQQSILPFGIGKRACPGESFGRSRVFLYITNILQKFDILSPVKHKLPPLTRQCWTAGLVLQVVKFHAIFKER